MASASRFRPMAGPLGWILGTCAALVLSACGSDDDAATVSAEVVEAHAVTTPTVTGATASLITHTMPSRLGGSTRATTLLFVPDGPAPAGGWPIVAWVHGTTTVAYKSCAPSQTLDTLDGGLTAEGFTSRYDEVVTSFLRAGYAVVAPDFEGLGSASADPFAYYDSASESRSIIAAVVAARRHDSSDDRARLARAVVIRERVCGCAAEAFEVGGHDGVAGTQEGGHDLVVAAGEAFGGQAAVQRVQGLARCAGLVGHRRRAVHPGHDRPAAGRRRAIGNEQQRRGTRAAAQTRRHGMGDQRCGGARHRGRRYRVRLHDLGRHGGRVVVATAGAQHQRGAGAKDPSERPRHGPESRRRCHEVSSMLCDAGARASPAGRC